MLWPSHAHVHAWIGDLLCQCSGNSRFLFIGGGSSILRHTTRLTDYRPLSSVAPPSFAPLPHSHHPMANSSPFYFSTFLKHPPRVFFTYVLMLLYSGGCFLKQTHLDSQHIFNTFSLFLFCSHQCLYITLVAGMYFVVGYKLLSSNLWTCGHVVSIQPCELQTFGRASLLVMLPQGYAEQSGFFCFFLPNSTLVKLFSVLQREGCTLCCLVFHFCQRRTPIITTELWGYGICKCVCVRESCCGAMWYCGRPGLVSAWNLA